MRVAVFLDEINRKDTAQSLELAQSWGIEAVEIRSLPSGRFPRAADAEIEELQRQIEGAGLLVSGVSPGLLKTPVTDPDVMQNLDQWLPRACEWALRLGTTGVSCFGFRRDGHDPATAPEEPPAQVIDYLGTMLRMTTAAGCRLVLENEAGCWGGTGMEAAQLIEQVPGLQLCWDPGNAARAGATSPYPDEYDAIRDLVTHVHLKNFSVDEQRWSVMDEGPVDWPGQIAALKEDGYDGYLVLETHTEILPQGIDDSGDMVPLAFNAHHNLTYLRQLLSR
ncbi:MAG: sugar phosphate isomerase/epimerase [Gemmatimonadetes bacterium]|nr:sugar phosphate isomerase/epimerase [Gemmatimonadota bacterium]MBT4610841.1 sugar phosphate isomerase/epimerase [Gemmatimonadota bacterium]MBT5055977.1 sugar phosphate isomerase/epimerase [Gemmatimonadota bacterium]MBT5143261.1 sugar phosphate isomerase/epimerase [Gemmatimonadota bacterium]MBT5586805.1 sugar phosphate isomerase/epimerase [Gemmatimonadota bacterium]